MGDPGFYACEQAWLRDSLCQLALCVECYDTLKSRSRKYLAEDDRPAIPRSRVHVRVIATSIWKRKSILMEHIGWHQTGRTVPERGAHLVAFTAAVPLFSSIATRDRRRIRPARIWRCLRSDYDLLWWKVCVMCMQCRIIICYLERYLGIRQVGRVDVWRTNSKLMLDCSLKPILNSSLSAVSIVLTRS